MINYGLRIYKQSVLRIMVKATGEKVGIIVSKEQIKYAGIIWLSNYTCKNKDKPQQIIAAV